MDRNRAGMRRDEALRILSEHREDIEEYGVMSLALFGSVARDDATSDSDVDILVEFDPEARVGMFDFLEFREYLEGILGHRVDLVAKAAVKQRLRDSILGEAITAA